MSAETIPATAEKDVSDLATRVGRDALHEVIGRHIEPFMIAPAVAESGSADSTVADLYGDAEDDAFDTETEVRTRNLTIRRPHEILEMEFSDTDCIAGDRLVAKGQPVVFCGPSGAGKSRLVLQFAAACVTGRKFVGFDTHGAGLKWLILQGENSNRRLRDDLLSLKRWCGDDWGAVEAALTFHTLEGVEDYFMNLDDPEFVCRAERVIDQEQPDVICFDPLNNFAIGDPNKDADMRATCQAISRMAFRGNAERVPLVVHHALTGKAGAARATGYERASFGRNSKVLHGWSRGQINIVPGNEDDNDVLVLSCGKNSNGREFAPFAVRLDQTTMIYEIDPEFDLEAWGIEIGGAKPKSPVCTVDSVTVALKRGPLSKKALRDALMEETGCGKSLAYKCVQKAEEKHAIARDPRTDAYAIAS